MKHCALAAAAALLGAAHAEPTTYTIDPTHTTVVFEILHFGTSTLRGRFDKKEGQLEVDSAAKTGRVDITMDIASVNTGVPAFNTELQGKDMFNAAEFPNARFVGDSFSFSGDKVTQVAGALTLLGRTHPVALKASRFNCYFSPLFKRQVCGGDFEATIRRSQWGLGSGIPADAADEVRLLVQVEAVKQ